MNLNSKFLTIRKLSEKIGQLKQEGKKIVHCHGCFDLMHPGHIRHFKQAKGFGDILIVTITPDRYVDKGPERPVFNEKLRSESIASLEVVDFVSINEWPTAEETLRFLKPNIFVKGQEFEDNDDITGKLQREKNVLKEIKAEMRYTRDIVFSSSNLLNKNFGLLSDDLNEFLEQFKEKFSFDYIYQVLDKIQSLKILVIGDAIIDDYHYCLPLNKAVKATAITSKYLGEETGIGGALCIANHLGEFCNQVTLLSCFGTKDNYLEFTQNNISKHVDLIPIMRNGAFTTKKRRYIDKVFHHKMFEIHFFDDLPIEDELQNKVCAFFRKHLAEFDLVVIGDFGHGLMTPRVINALCNFDIFIAGTVQTNSNNFGFNYINKYPRLSYAAIDEREVRLACQDRFSPIENLVENLTRQLHCRQMAITLGRKGSILFNKKYFRRAPIVSAEVVDTIGSGDAFLALTSPAAYLNENPDTLLLLGNAAGAMAANIVGNRESISKEEYIKFLGVILK